MNRSILIVVSLIFLMPLGFCRAQSLDVLPDELAPGVPKTEMMTAWLKKQAVAAIDRRDAAFEKLADEELKIWQQDRREFFRRQLGGFPERTPLNAKVTGRLTIDDS